MRIQTLLHVGSFLGTQNIRTKGVRKNNNRRISPILQRNRSQLSTTFKVINPIIPDNR